MMNEAGKSERPDLLSRRTFMAGLGAGAAATMLPWQTESPPTESPPHREPNIVFVIVDDMGWADLGCYGGRAIKTPNLDRMAREGIRFTNAYSACSVCAPARSCLMTGLHMGHTSVRLNTGGVPLAEDDYTVAKLLNDGGYRVGGFGKWGLGELGTDGVPERHGFDSFYGYYHQIHAHYYLTDYLIRNGRKEALPGNAGFYEKYPHMKYSGAFPRKDAESGLTREYASDLIFEETLRFIKQEAASGKPFFCYAPWAPPHGEYLMPDDDPAWKTYAGREDWPVRARVVAAYTAMVDRHVGQLLDLLEKLKIVDDTIVLFCSDNGADEDYDGALDCCGPLRGKKRSLYEGGLRVPMIARWPGRIPAGIVTDHACYFPDVMPTLADLADLADPADMKPSLAIDGISFLPTLLQEGEQRKHDYLYWEWERYDWGKRALVPDGLIQAVRKGKWKAVRKASSGPIELFDLETDLGEKKDVADAHPARIEEMARIMTEARHPMRPQEEPPRVDGRPFR